MKEVRLKLCHSTLLLSLALCAAVQAAPTAETEATFQHALHIAEDNKRQMDLIVEQEQQGKIDKRALTEAIQEAAKKAETFESELRKASSEGHGVATYLLATLTEGRKTMGQDYAMKHTEACALYQRATDQGLLASAVMQLRDCDVAYQRFKFNDPELLRLRGQLLKALERQDPYSDHYPLPVLNSYCFKESKEPQVNRQQPLTSLRDLYTPVLLSQEQFRADGYYLLALKGDIENPAARSYFKQVKDQAPDCLDPVNLNIMFEHMDRKSH
ncbi:MULTISPECIES: hypothetical protein [Pseudomonas]|uniref:hypothetical protein n=1 Tax=Pseudomonas TaxID=286 RepID=UPI001FCADF99|nr:hypothetical protein [Pseudomonas palleroniana]UOK40923.1 hypothetical protein MJP36_14110 [Pseudomonas palleroniana]